MYMQLTTSGAAGNGLYTTIKYMRGASVHLHFPVRALDSSPGLWVVGWLVIL
jgi:hypothetical protein